MNPEIALLNKIINSGDIVTAINSGCDKCFTLCQEEWNWLRDHYRDYRMVAPANVFFDKFKSIPAIETDGDMAFYIDELQKWKAQHDLQNIITDSVYTLKNEGPYRTLHKMHSRLSKLGRDTRLVKDVDLVTNADERLENLRERIALRASGKQLLGIPTGISIIDEKFGGWQKGDFVVIAGFSGHFKSYLALYFGINAWLEGYRVLYISLEMSALQVGYRFDTFLGGGQFTNTGLTHAKDIYFDEYKTWLGDALKNKQSFVVVTNEALDEINPLTIEGKIDTWHPNLVIVDYLNLMDTVDGGGSETDRIRDLSKAIKRMCIKTGVPFIVITSVTQDKKDIGEKPPELHELAYSKQLAYDSDLTLALCRHGDILEVISRKHRRSDEIHFHVETEVNRGIFKEIIHRTLVDDDEE